MHISDAAIIQNIEGLVDGIANAYHPDSLSDQESEDWASSSDMQGPQPEADGTACSDPALIGAPFSPFEYTNLPPGASACVVGRCSIRSDSRTSF